MELVEGSDIFLEFDRNNGGGRGETYYRKSGVCAWGGRSSGRGLRKFRGRYCSEGRGRRWRRGRGELES